MGTCWDVAQEFTRIAQDLAAHGSGHAATARVTELAHATYGGDLAAVWRCSDAGPRLDSATDALAGKRLNHIVTDTRQGPVVTALHERTTVIVSDLWDEPRWPGYRQRLLREQLPIRAVAAFCLSGTDGDLGALVLYSAEPGYFTPDHTGPATLFAAHAAIAVQAARAADTVHHLRQALSSNRRIGMAIGILMALHHVTDDTAFDLLRTASQHLHRKICDLAEDVIDTGALPDWPTPTRSGRRPHAYHAAEHQPS